MNAASLSASPLSASRELRDEPQLPSELEAAIQWLVTLRSVEVTDALRLEFSRWIAQDPSHASAWERLAGSLVPIDAINTVPMPMGSLARSTLRRTRDRRSFLALCLGAGSVGVVGTIAADHFVALDDVLADHVTWLGQQKTVTLADGSRLALAPRTAVDTNLGADRRDIVLRHGEIMLDAQADYRPIAVNVGDLRLAAEHGSFVAERSGTFQSVTAVDQPATLSCAGFSETRLLPGEFCSLDNGRLTKGQADLELDTNWVHGNLFVKDRDLGFVVSRLRPYFSGILRLEPSIETLRVSGIFPLFDIHQSLNMLAVNLGLTVHTISPYWVTIAGTVAT